MEDEREREREKEKKQELVERTKKNDQRGNEQREAEGKTGEENETEENSEKHFRVSGKNSLSRIEGVYANVRAYLNEAGTR